MSTTAANHAVPPLEFLQLVGHPLRWRLLGELAHSDRTVDELRELVGERHNLVSYHLAKLRDARLISGKRSAADRRDAYYTVDLAKIGDLLSVAGGTLHPGLRLTPSVEKAPPRAAKVLFLCTGNSARSQMAEALIKARSGGTIKAYSAGRQPKALHPNATRVMREEYGIDLTGYAPKHLNMFVKRKFDRVISLCDLLREDCPEFGGNRETVHWSIANPATGEPDAITYPLFQRTAEELATRIDFLLAGLIDRPSAS